MLGLGFRRLSLHWFLAFVLSLGCFLLALVSSRVVDVFVVGSIFTLHFYLVLVPFFLVW